jgi:hypothetical protein
MQPYNYPTVSMAGFKVVFPGFMFALIDRAGFRTKRRHRAVSLSLVGLTFIAATI